MGCLGGTGEIEAGWGGSIAGISRSTIIVMAYVMTMTGKKRERLAFPALQVEVSWGDTSWYVQVGPISYLSTSGDQEGGREEERSSGSGTKGQMGSYLGTIVRK